MRVEVNFKDYKNGAISPIETIEIEEDYTPVDYLEDYKKWCLSGLENIYDDGEILFLKI